MVAGLVAILLLGAGALFLRGGDDPATLGPGPLGNTSIAQGAQTTQGGAVQAPPVTNSGGPVQGKAIAPIRPGQYPDFVGADLVSSLAVLRDNDMRYVIMEVFNDNVAKGLVISQSPSAGGTAGPNTAITLVVSRGPATTATSQR
jgi:hypothetical protein